MAAGDPKVLFVVDKQIRYYLPRNLDSMFCAGRSFRIAAASVLLILLPSLTLAQENRLRTPTIAASAAAAADWASTYYALKYYKVRELNPIINPLQHQPGAHDLHGCRDRRRDRLRVEPRRSDARTSASPWRDSGR